MTNWEEQKFGDLYLIPSRNGLTRPSSVRGAGYKFINMGEIFAYNRIGNIETELVQLNEKEKKEMTLQKNDLLFARQSLVFSGAGKCSIMLDVEDVVSFESHLIRVRLNPEIANPMFYYYYFTLPYNSVKTIVQQCAQAGIRGGDLEKIKVPCPHIEVQKQIADILSAYDDLIEANNRRIELLEQTEQELYKEWFVRFRFPGYENAKFENGLPEGWQIKRIGDLFDITSSKRVYLADYVDDGVPFYRSKEIIQLSQGQSITEPLYISNESYENFKSKYGTPEKNDILITSVGTIGVSYLVDGHEFYFKDGNLTWIKSSSDKMLSLYLFQWLNSHGGKQQLLQSTIGTSQSALTIENLKKIKLLVPTKEVVEDYFNKTHAMLEQKRALQLNKKNLEAQRDMLLPRLMSGKLEVYV